MQTAIVGIGCFWKETEFKKLKGVISTEVGYCGGNTNKTDYKKVCSGVCNSAEVVKLNFDEKILTFENLLRFFFSIHNPTTLNRQGPDIGTQYRSEIFYINDDQKKVAEKIRDEFNKKLNGKVVTKISQELNYVCAEEYHQKYFEKRGI
mgnify:CR=1 FL=1|tara:strand:+ start:2237 stop:2683 length:447 start_codon:yes stop_codon:yes gene_type:complete